ncbi:MAG TPA: SDR family oxidoreductase [Stellaceae bacterium]|nr:SDR family oxidoreductase [Stellaceae bacterium]
MFFQMVFAVVRCRHPVKLGVPGWQPLRTPPETTEGAVEFAPQRVRVNAIAPSATMTDRVRGRLEAGNPRVTKLAASHLLGLIEPEDIANMAVFLASEESRMVTGHVYPVDSGVTIS